MRTLIYRYTTRKGQQYEKHIEIDDEDNGIIAAFERSPKGGVRTLKKLLPRHSHLDFVALIPYQVEMLQEFPKLRLKGKLFDGC